MPYDASDALNALALGERLRELIKRSGKTQRQVADEAGIPQPSYLSHMVNGRINWVESSYFPGLASALQLSIREIEQLRPDAVTPIVTAAVQAGYQMAGYHLPHPDTVRSSERVRIPVYALAAAGVGTWTEDEVVDYIEVEPDVAYRRNRTTFQVDGDSMEPTLSSGDYIHVDIADQDIRDNKIYVIKVKGNGIVVKRARVYDDGTVSLLSDNPRHPPLKPDDAIVIGRVFGYNQAFRPL